MEFITSPDAFMQKKKGTGFKVPVLIVLLSGIVGAVGASFSAPLMANLIKDLMIQQGIDPQQAEIFSRLTYYSTIIGPVVMPFIGWLLVTVLLYAISSLLDGRGDFKTLLRLTAFSFIPLLVVSPISIYFAYHSAQMLAIYGLEWAKTMNPFTISQTILSIAILFWQFLYWTFAVKNARELNLKKSAITSSVPLAVMLCLHAFSLILSTTP
jgi:hypothetical protein